MWVKRFNEIEEGRVELNFSEQDFWRTQHFIFGFNTVKSHFKVLGIYNFTRGFGWAYERGGGGGLISGWAYKRIKKMFRKGEIKRV